VKGVTFGAKHSYDNFGLILASKTIGMPEPKTETADIATRDGVIDLTESLGSVKYSNRILTLTFTLPESECHWPSRLSEIANYLHGKKMEIFLDDDKGWYYYGRCTVNEYVSEKTLGTVVIECDVEPYKQEINSPGKPWKWDPFNFINGIVYPYDIVVNNTVTINLFSRARIVSPTFTCSSAMAVTYNGHTYQLPAGRTKVYEINLSQGDNAVTFSGNGTVNIEYEGGLL